MLRHLGLTFLSLAMTLSISNAYAKEQLPPYSTSPVDRFAKFDIGLYRGAAPDTIDKMKALKAAGIRTIINMQTDVKKIAVEEAAAKALGMRHISIPLPGFSAPNDADVQHIQALLVDPTLKPLFMHCTHGRERTGIETAIYRVYQQNWTPQKAYAEAKAFGFRPIVWPMKSYFEKLTHTEL